MPPKKKAKTGELKRPLEIGEGQVQPEGTVVTTSPTSAVAMGNLRPVSAGRSPEAQADIEASRVDQPTPNTFSQGLIPNPEPQAERLPRAVSESIPQAVSESIPMAQDQATAPEVGIDHNEVLVAVGEGALDRANDEGHTDEQAREIGKQRGQELADSPSAMARIRASDIDDLDWKDKLAVIFISLAGGTILGEASGAGATTGFLAGGTAGFGELSKREDENRAQARDLQKIQAKAGAAGAKRKLQSKAVEFSDGSLGFVNFDASSGRYFNAEGEDVSEDVRPISKLLQDENNNIFRRNPNTGILQKVGVARTPKGDIEVSESGTVKATPSDTLEVTPPPPGSDEAPAGVIVPGAGVDSIVGTAPNSPAATRAGSAAGGDAAALGARLNGAGVPVNPEILEEIAGTQVPKMLTELEALKREKDASPGFFPKSKSARILQLQNDIKEESDDLLKRSRDRTEKDRDRKEADAKFIRDKEVIARYAGTLRGHDGEILPVNLVKSVLIKQAKADSLTAVRDALSNKLKQFNLAIKQGNKQKAIRLGNSMIKLMNSDLGPDAVGVDEARRLGNALVFQVANFVNPGPIVGRDLKGFRDQVDATIDGFDDTIVDTKKAIARITPSKDRGEPLIRSDSFNRRIRYDELEMNKFFWNEDGKRFQKTPQGVKRVK